MAEGQPDQGGEYGDMVKQENAQSPRSDKNEDKPNITDQDVSAKEGVKVKKEEADKNEDSSINNPYLRPVRMPRNAIVGATVPKRIQPML